MLVPFVGTAAQRARAQRPLYARVLRPNGRDPVPLTDPERGRAYDESSPLSSGRFYPRNVPRLLPHQGCPEDLFATRKVQPGLAERCVLARRRVSACDEVRNSGDSFPLSLARLIRKSSIVRSSVERRQH